MPIYTEKHEQKEDHTKPILEILEETKGMGVTPRQISDRIDIQKEEIISTLQRLRMKGKADRYGRNLWVHVKYKDLKNIPDFISPEKYSEEFNEKFNISLRQDFQNINFNSNINEPIHRWSPYIQGFSSEFVNGTLHRYGVKVDGDRGILDPMAGSGTVLVEAKKRGMKNIGIEMMPLMAFTSEVKTTWDLDVDAIGKELNGLNLDRPADESKAPSFLRSEDHFEQDVLKDLIRLKESISEAGDVKIRNLFKLALAGILIDCSNLKRSPCLGYEDNQTLFETNPLKLFRRKVGNMIEDLKNVQSLKKWGQTEVINKDAGKVQYEPNSIDIAITSPPYMNGIDYVMNYKMEMAWLDFVSKYEDLSELKDNMIVCDNVSRGLIRDFAEKDGHYSDNWLDEIVERMTQKMKIKKSYRRTDMPLVVQKYFDDLFPIFRNVYRGLKKGGRFVIVIGDSLIATVYIPTDLLLAKMGVKVGFEVEEFRIARERRSGQRTSFHLRESIITLKK